MDKAELQHEKRDSIAIKRNAKGEYAWDIKVYFDREDDTVTYISGYLKRVDAELKESFLG